MTVTESSYVSAGGKKALEGALKKKTIMVFPLFEAPYEVDIQEQAGGHGGGDPVLLEELFGTTPEDQFHRAADHIDGAMSILTGIAANKSIMTGQPVHIKDLVTF